MGNTQNPYDYRTPEALAITLNKLADSPRSLSPEDRALVLRAAAAKLDGGDTAHAIDLGDDFTFVPNPRVGTLHHPTGEDGVFLRDVTEGDARKVVASLTAMEWWQARDGAAS